MRTGVRLAATPAHHCHLVLLLLFLNLEPSVVLVQSVIFVQLPVRMMIVRSLAVAHRLGMWVEGPLRQGVTVSVSV